MQLWSTQLKLQLWGPRPGICTITKFHTPLTKVRSHQQDASGKGSWYRPQLNGMTVSVQCPCTSRYLPPPSTSYSPHRECSQAPQPRRQTLSVRTGTGTPRYIQTSTYTKIGMMQRAKPLSQLSRTARRLRKVNAEHSSRVERLTTAAR